MNPLLLADYYKTEHFKMYPKGTSLIYSNFTPRKSRLKGVNSVVFFGLQHFIMTYLINIFNEQFFGGKLEREISSHHIDGKDWHKKRLIKEYEKHINVDTKHIEALYNLGYLPVEIKAVPEGTLVPIGVPCFTIKNTNPDFAWLTNYLETLISTMMWQPITSATIANEYRKLLERYALETVGNIDFVQWQAHDFSMRGMSSVESAILSGMGHLTSFTGTDSIPAIYQLEETYGAKGLVGASVPATEHSVMCMGSKESEIETFERLLDLYPTGILSVVSDTWDLWKVCTKFLPKLKDKILSREGKLVIRPDSGDPIDIICGTKYQKENKDGWQTKSTEAEFKGVIELLWDVFGGTINSKGYKELDSHIGAIYGDSITLERAEQICERLKAKRFASTNIVFGVGSYTYQYNTRDTFGFAIKATYGEVNGEGREIFKDPITDDGTKRSAKGLLRVTENLKLVDQQTWAGEGVGLLQTVFKDGEMVRITNLEDIRRRIKQVEETKREVV